MERVEVVVSTPLKSRVRAFQSASSKEKETTLKEKKRRKNDHSEEGNEDRRNVSSCFRAPGAQISAPRPEATSRFNPSRECTRPRLDWFCEREPGSGRSSHSCARRQLCQGFRSEECRTANIAVRRKWNLRDARW